MTESPSLADNPTINAAAAELMAALHDALRRNGYAGEPLAVLLVRVMFCLFADHTLIFPRGLFREIIDRKTRADGAGLGPMLHQIFAVLDQPTESRQRNLDEDLAELPYVNGRLFEARFDPPAFDGPARRTLLQCCAFDWSAVSPAIFGSMFQMVMDESKGRRRAIGAHYTSEKNILKAAGPLLLDGLREELKKATSEAALTGLYQRITETAVLDPACGCGNFLVVIYRELRRIQIEILQKLHAKPRSAGPFFSVDFTGGVNVDAMHGIEIEEFPCRVAEVALYLTDHLMNMEASKAFGKLMLRLPLSKAPHIVHANALRLDWAEVVPAKRLACVVGNPPFIGKGVRTSEQAADMVSVFGEWEGHGELDYVAAWHVKALQYVKGTEVPVAFVSTNSLTQGEQVSILWPRLIAEGLQIWFAHRTFKWSNDAPGQANVFCVIIGWGVGDKAGKRIFDYETPKAEPLARVVHHINPYLVDAVDTFIKSRRVPLCPAPAITFGSMPNDGGHLLLDAAQRAKLIKAEPKAAAFIRPFIGAREFLNNERKWCLWLAEAEPSVIRDQPLVKEKVAAVRKYRAASKRPATRKLAEAPALFGEIRQPSKPYIIIPRVSSENRRFIPMAIVKPSEIAGDTCVVVRSNDPYVFGVLQSTMHMAWTRQVCGRLEGRYRYSNEIVYNNFPWPEPPAPAQLEAVKSAAKALLQVRAGFKGQSLADLYDADLMPAPLAAAHRALDRAVDRCYRREPFKGELSRVAFLFERYAALASNGHLPLDIPEPESSPGQRGGVTEVKAKRNSR